MCRVIDDLYKLNDWEDSHSLNSEDVKLVLNLLFIHPPIDIFKQAINQHSPVTKNNLNLIIKELEQYKLNGNDVSNLIKDFSTDNKINRDLLNTILIENGMNKDHLKELLQIVLRNEDNNNDVDITKLADGLNSLLKN